MSNVRRFSTALRSPWAWAKPLLRVERRTDGRVGQPRCFLFKNEVGEVVPTVYVFRNRHPGIEPRQDEALRRIQYDDIDEVIAAGWRPHSSEQLDLGFDPAGSASATG